MKLTTLLAIILMALQLNAQTIDQTIIFHYRADGKTLEQVIEQFASPRYQSEERKKQLIEEIKISSPTITSQLKETSKVVSIVILRSQIDLYKLKQYYLSIEGGKNYTEELYSEELRRTEWANSFDNKTLLSVSYSYLPFYKIQTNDNSKEADFNSLLGLNASIEQQWNEFELPLFTSFDLHYRRWSNFQALSQTTPDEQRETVSPSPTLDYDVHIGITPRLSIWRYIVKYSKETNYLADYSQTEDHSYLVEDNRHFFSLGFDYTIKSKKEKLAIISSFAGLSFSDDSNNIYNEATTGPSQLDNKTAWKTEFDTKYFWHKSSYIEYQLKLIFWPKENWLQAHTISFGHIF